MTSNPKRTAFRLLFIHLAVGSCLSTCTPEEDGMCRVAAATTDLEVCASSYWQTVPKGAYQCADGRMIPLTSLENATTAQEHSSPCSDSSTADTSANASPAASASHAPSTAKSSSASQLSQTGNSVCTNSSVPVHEDGYGVVSYTKGGRMASVYVAADTAAFHCEIKPPADGMYVAVWTRYDPKVTEQPKPKNCGETIKLTNPKTGVSSDAMVLDRCASCVGVDHQISDNTTYDNYANGATIDLSVALWNKLYNGAPQAVYDVLYDGPIYGGSDSGSPDELISPNCESKGGPN